jgi:hypothetical protein
MKVEVVQNFLLQEALKAHHKKRITDSVYKQIIRLLCSTDKEVIKLGAKKLNHHICQ